MSDRPGEPAPAPGTARSPLGAHPVRDVPKVRGPGRQLQAGQILGLRMAMYGFLDAARRQAWLNDKWPTILRAAKRCKGLILFEDEASFAQWGSLSYTWARRGRQPEVPTSGKRKGYKVFGAIEYFSGRLFYQGIEGRCNSEKIGRASCRERVL